MSRVRSGVAWGGLTSLLFLAVVWLIGLVGRLDVWSGPDLPATVAVALALGALIGLGVYWQWSLAEACGSTLWNEVNEMWSPEPDSERNGEVAE